MDKREQKEKILDGINGQIASFDNKASILISVIGIVFALSLSFLDVFSEEKFLDKSCTYKVYYYILFILFILNTVFVVMSYIFVIIPRKKIGKNRYANYYKDMSKLDINDINNYNKYFEDYTKDDNLLTEQIIINSKICNRKHLWLKIGIMSLVPFALLLLVVILMTIF